MSCIRYIWPDFRLVHDTETGHTMTHYAGGHWSGGDVVPDDAFHADLLGITPERHRLAHEVGHHLTAIAMQYEGCSMGCRIVYRDAHHIPQVHPEAGIDEWRINALVYYTYERQMREAGDFGALMDLQNAGNDLPGLAGYFRWLLSAADMGQGVTIRLQAPQEATRVLRAA